MIKVNPLPALLPEGVIEEVKLLPTCLLSDTLSGLGAMDYKIKPIANGMKLTGTAFTVNFKAGNALAVIAAAALVSNGYVLVIGGKGDDCKALLGEIITKTSIKKGCEGIVLDGMVRDVEELRECGMPIFGKGVVPTSAEKEGPGEINGIVSCGGVVVNPGDLVVGDDNGVVVVPRDKLHEVIEAARGKVATELCRLQEIESGLVMPEWLKNQLAGELE